MVIARRAAQISGHSSEIEVPTSPIEGRALFLGKPTLAVEAPSFSITEATPGLEERTLPLSRTHGDHFRGPRRNARAYFLRAGRRSEHHGHRAAGILDLQLHSVGRRTHRQRHVPTAEIDAAHFDVAPGARQSRRKPQLARRSVPADAKPPP